MKNRFPHPKKPVIALFLLLIFCLPALACNLGEGGVQETITTIQSPEQETRIAYADRLTLVVPANTVPQGSQVSIRASSAAQAHEYSGLRSLGAYDIRISDLKTFPNPLVIQVKYDPASLRKDLAAQDQLFAAYLDETTQRWVEADFSLDEVNATVTIQADHLSLWSIFGLADDTVVSTSPHFKIYFNEKLNAPLLGTKASGAGLIYDFAAQVRAALVDTYDRYASPQGSSGTGFKLPEMTNVYIDDWGPEKTAAWGWFSKSIEIPITYSSLDELNQDSAHELFHAVQNQYVRVPSMITSRWWMEATADYAAAYIGTGNGLKTTLALDFIKKPLDDSEEKHTYQAAHFIDYLSQQGIDFKDLFEVTMLSSGDVLGAIHSYVSSQGQSLADFYSDFAFSFIFGSKLQKAAPVQDVPAQLADFNGEYSRDTGTTSQLVDVPQNYATRLAAFKISDTPDVSYPVYLSALEPTSEVQVRFVIAASASPDSLLQAGTLAAGQPEKVQIQGGNYIYFMVTNAGSSPGSVTVAIEQPAGVTSYSNERTAKIYNGFYTANISLDLISSHAFKVLAEKVSPNGETLVLDIRLATGLKPEETATIEVTAEVSDLVITEAGEHPNLTAILHETGWALPGSTTSSGGTANYSFTGAATKAASLTFEVYINNANSLDENRETPFGSAAVIIIHVIP